MKADRLAALVTITLLLLLAWGAVSVIRRAWTADARTATATHALDSVTTTLHAVQQVARAGMATTAQQRDVIDSLSARIRDARPLARTRQNTVMMTDVRDTLAVVQALITLTAERDTAVADLGVARVALASMQTDADALRLVALEHVRADSVQFAAIDRAAGAAVGQVTTARDAIRPRWWRRLGHGLAQTARVSAVVVVAFTLGRIT
jgi:hypothetical protein